MICGSVFRNHWWQYVHWKSPNSNTATGALAEPRPGVRELIRRGPEPDTVALPLLWVSENAKYPATEAKTRTAPIRKTILRVLGVERNRRGKTHAYEDREFRSKLL